ncbi:MAG TPA: hypothetical protein VGJ57_06970 [Nitrospirales bacterium]
MKGSAVPNKAVYVPFIKRNHYFHGKILAEKDLSDEQHYFREKQRLLNLHLFGWGTVSGLQVSASNSDITVTPGMALDCYGREMVLIRPATVPLPKKRRGWWVVVKYAERRTDPVPVPADGGNSSQPSRIEEGLEISYDSENPCDQKTKKDVGPESIAIAKLKWKQNGWHVAKRLPCPRIRIRR